MDRGGTLSLLFRHLADAAGGHRRPSRPCLSVSVSLTRPPPSESARPVSRALARPFAQPASGSLSALRTPSRCLSLHTTHAAIRWFERDPVRPRAFGQGGRPRDYRLQPRPRPGRVDRPSVRSSDSRRHRHRRVVTAVTSRPVGNGLTAAELQRSPSCEGRASSPFFGGVHSPVPTPSRAMRSFPGNMTGGKVLLRTALE